MALNKVTYVDNVTVIGATNLNAIQDEIIANGTSIGTLSSGKVDKVTGKGLSTNDFTNDQVQKLAGIQNGANVADVAYDTTNHKLTKTINGTDADVMTVDAEPTENSTNPVTSGGVHSVIGELSEQVEEAVKGTALEAFPTATLTDQTIASFSDGADDIPVKSLVAHVEPKQSGSGDPSLDNIRPISGWTGMKIFNTRKNLFGGTALRDGIKTSIPAATDYPDAGYIQFTAGATVRVPDIAENVKFKENTQYTFIIMIAKLSGVSTNLVVRYTDGTYNYIPALDGDVTTKHCQILVTPEGKTVREFSKSNNSESVQLYYNESGIFEGVLTTDDFEPYTGEQYDIEFPTEAGTVYGGTLDVTSGTLNVDMVIKVFDGTETMTNNSSGNARHVKYKLGAYGSVLPSSDIKACCSILPKVTITNTNTAKGFNTVRSSAYNGDFLYFRPFDMYDEETGTQKGVEDVKELFATLYANGTPCQVAYQIKDPVTYQLTPTEVKTLLGLNNIWVDTGNVDVTYRADPTLQTTQQAQTVFGMLAPTEDGETASQAYAQGKYFIRGGQFCKALVAIESGATFTLGTNYSVTNLADELFSALS